MISRPSTSFKYAKKTLAELKPILEQGPLAHLNAGIPHRSANLFFGLVPLLFLISCGFNSLGLVINLLGENHEYFDTFVFCCVISSVASTLILFYILLQKGDCRPYCFALLALITLQLFQNIFVLPEPDFLAQILPVIAYVFASSKGAAVCAQITSFRRNHYNKKWYEENVKK